MLLKEALRTPKSSESGFPFVSHTIFDETRHGLDFLFLGCRPSGKMGGDMNHGDFNGEVMINHDKPWDLGEACFGTHV